MASLYKKVISGKPYWYLREMAWVDGKPKMVSERYLGSAADIEALLDAREAAVLPERTRHLAFGDVAAVWGMLERLGVVAMIDEVVGARRPDAGASVGTYLALAALNRLVDPCSKRGVRGLVEDHRRGPVHQDQRRGAGPPPVLGRDARGHAWISWPGSSTAWRCGSCTFGLDISAVALDMTNFATYIDTTNDKAPIAQRGKAKQKRTDLRLVGLGLVVTRDGGIPLVSHAYPGNRPDVTQFATMIDLLVGRHRRPAPTAARPAGGRGDDGGVRRRAELGGQLRPPGRTGLRFVGSVPPSDCADLLALPATAAHRRGRRPVRRADRAATPAARSTAPSGASCSPTPRPCTTAQSRGFDHHPGQGRRETHRAGRHPGPR